MSPLPLIIKEIAHRRLNFVLSVLAVVAAVAMFVFLSMTLDASERETSRLTRDLGFNIRIVPKETDRTAFYHQGFSDFTMSEELVDRLARQESVSYNHVLATLQQRVEVNGVPVLVTGVGESQWTPDNKKKSRMQYAMDPGTIHIGFEAARRLKAQRGDTLTIGGQSFTIARVAPEQGDVTDTQVIGPLRDIQQALNLPGRINEIKAIDCLQCQPAEGSPVDLIRGEIDQILPEASVLHMTQIAEPRTRLRQTAERYTRILLPIVVIGCACWVGVLAVMNVRDRQPEIGLMRALGYGSGMIGTLFLGKAVLVGLMGAAGGYFLGMGLAMWIGPGIFELTQKAIQPVPMLLLYAALAAPVFAALASFVPAMLAVTQDPAATLRPE